MNTGLSNCPEERMPTVLNFVDYCAKELMPRQRRKILVYIDFEENLFDTEGILGDCDFDSSMQPPDWYDIRVDRSLSNDDLLLTLAHELVHIKQYARRELKQLMRSPYYRFRKEYFHNSTPYAERPWEIEAYELESELVENFLTSANQFATLHTPIN